MTFILRLGANSVFEQINKCDPGSIQTERALRMHALLEELWNYRLRNKKRKTRRWYIAFCESTIAEISKNNIANLSQIRTRARIENLIFCEVEKRVAFKEWKKF